MSKEKRIEEMVVDGLEALGHSHSMNMYDLHNVTTEKDGYVLPFSSRVWNSLLTRRPLTNKLQGQILTVIDSSIPDEKQNKAMKDLIKEIFSRYFDDEFEFDRALSGEIHDGLLLAQDKDHEDLKQPITNGRSWLRNLYGGAAPGRDKNINIFTDAPLK